jgi:hypothetical protein
VTRRTRIHWFATIIAVLAIAAGCGSSPAPAADTAASAGVQHDTNPGEVDPALVGCWRGYWSPRGDADTERHLFLSDGRWAWIALKEAVEGGHSSVARRSGRWGVREGVITLVEHQRKERAGCADPDDANQSCPEGQKCPCDEIGFRIVKHDAPIVKQLSLDECPPNREAEQLDASYTCRSVDGQAFWRHAAPEDVDQKVFFGE